MSLFEDQGRIPVNVLTHILPEGNHEITASYPSTDIETEASVRSHKREKHASLRRSRSDANYGNCDLTERNQTVMVRFPPAALETEGSVQSQKQRRHAVLRRSRSDANYGFEVHGNSDVIEGNQTAMTSFSSTALAMEPSVRSHKRENLRTLRRLSLDANHGSEVQRNSNSTIGNQKAVVSFPPATLEVESSFRSQKRENHAPLR